MPAIGPALVTHADAARCPITAARSPTIGAGDPVAGRFTAAVTNPWFPLRPGTVMRYRGTKDGRRARDVVSVSARVTRIMGIPAATVRDRLFLDGELVERTTDWYSQDRSGNVWYLGEATAELEGGRVVSREGSFRAGTDGARGGIVMPAHPRRGREYRQELLPGHAEDRARIQSLRAAVRVPFVSSRRALRTLECTPLEPRVLDVKVYVRGLGTVTERQVRGPGPREALSLVSVRRPR